MRTLRLAVALAGVLLVSVPAVASARADWVQGALADQYELGSSLPLRNAPWVGTHNSFNSVAEMSPTLSDLDSNQQIKIVDQLDLGVRSIELDLHWIPSLSPYGGFSPVVCHGTDKHVGCSIEKPLGPVLDEIGGWLREPEHRDQVLLLYLEDHLDNATGYDTAAATVEQKLGDL
ncbi:MAG: hypothetical protein ACJ75R_04990, partial [Solirubrobacterales bacterium]